MRLLIFIGVIYLLYKYFKSWMSPSQQTRKTTYSRNQSDVVDEMVKDPVCGVYFPKREGFRLNDNGNNLYFCSEKCREKYRN